MGEDLNVFSQPWVGQMVKVCAPGLSVSEWWSLVVLCAPGLSVSDWWSLVVPCAPALSVSDWWSLVVLCAPGLSVSEWQPVVPILMLPQGSSLAHKLLVVCRRRWEIPKTCCCIESQSCRLSVVCRICCLTDQLLGKNKKHYYTVHVGSGVEEK